ncbi:hypothetical protein [Falsiroseomonas stagni]|uniref:Uncharacterized protein n=1 Tax=Falsiroseomonas stagni DSM 19981 TaxID=1123062 RepID=A0A1I4BFD1_9PROT|nr:hypothetical protein [Falsiroseomonas stagni]SFK67572.1 hypothetical protein SAMN02745775_105261 [Falsiroseomonas stagni DSM 19981]
MAGRWWLWVALAGLVAAGPCHASGVDGFPAEEVVFPAAADAAPAGLVLRPPGWLAGDATVVLAPSAAWPPGLRDRLATALAEAGAAVVEATAPMEAVLAGLRRDGGILVVIAPGAAVPVAEGVTGAIALDPEGPRTRLGVVPPAAEAWPLRATLLCRLLAASLGAGAPPSWPGQCAAGLSATRQGPERDAPGA